MSDIYNNIWQGDLNVTGNLTVNGTTPTPFTNIVIVGGIAHLPPAVGGKHTLLANTLYWIDATVLNLGTNYIEFSNGSTLRGNSSLSNTILYSGAGSALRGTDVNASITFISVAAPKAYDFSNVARDKFLSIQQVGIANQTFQSTVVGYSVFITFIVNYINCVGGFNLTNNGKIIYRYHNWTASNSGSFMTINPDNSTEANITACDIVVNTGASNKGIDVTSTNIKSAIIESNTFSGTAPVSQRLIGVNGNTAGWVIIYGLNVGIAGLQFVDVEISTTNSVPGNAAGTFVDGSSVKGFALSLNNYDPLATVMEGKITALFTTSVNIEVGIRNHTTGINLGGLSSSTNGTNIIIETSFVNITPGNEYTGYYIKQQGVGTTRKSLKLTLKIF